MSLDCICLEDICHLYFILAKAEGSVSMYNLTFMLQSDWKHWKHNAKVCLDPDANNMLSCTALIVKLLSCVRLCYVIMMHDKRSC